MAGLIQIGRSALSAAYTQLQTSGHNIANVNTPGYVRQEVVLASAEGQYRGSGYIGNGVNVQDIRRNYDRFMADEVTRSTSIAGTDKVRAQQLGLIDNLLADTDSGIGVAMDSFRASMADLVNNPNDGSARTVVAQRAAVVAGRFSDTATRLEALVAESSQKVEDAAQYVNARLQEVATLNRQISMARGNNQQPNDLLDQRDALINELAAKIQVTRDEQDDGSVDLYSASGYSLVLSDRAARLVMQPTEGDASRPNLAVDVQGHQIPLSESTLGSGEIAGLLRFRDQDLRSVQASLGRLAAAFAGAYNHQQALGLDAHGRTGQPMFSVGDPVVQAEGGNAGDLVMKVTVADPAKLKAADYRLSFDGNVYTLEDAITQRRQEYTQLPIEADGLLFARVSGGMRAGDVMTVQAGSAFASRMRSALSGPDSVAAAAALGVVPGKTNRGDAYVTSFGQREPHADFDKPLTLTFTGPDEFTLSGPGANDPGPHPYVAGQPIEMNGWRMVVQGVPAAGDTVAVVRPVAIRKDNNNARAMLALPDQAEVDGMTFSQAFAAVLSDVGGRTLQAKTADRASAKMLEGAKALVADRSGVNLDEEAARLLQYRQAYQAAAKVIQTADEMFNSILSLAR
ncbi:MAG: flagellar hook-associated protein FlgK [Lautropia sp.]|nr:flagellar hook-associated protein FlgK [Lautropia sp.]